MDYRKDELVKNLIDFFMCMMLNLNIFLQNNYLPMLDNLNDFYPKQLP